MTLRHESVCLFKNAWDYGGESKHISWAQPSVLAKEQGQENWHLMISPADVKECSITFKRLIPSPHICHSLTSSTWRFLVHLFIYSMETPLSSLALLQKDYDSHVDFKELKAQLKWSFVFLKFTNQTLYWWQLFSALCWGQLLRS